MPRRGSADAGETPREYLRVMSDRQEHLFVVRLWTEAPGVIRGFVDHIQSGQRLYFAEPQTIVDFLHLRLRENETPHST
jgi:hypothetical protein